MKREKFDEMFNNQAEIMELQVLNDLFRKQIDMNNMRIDFLMGRNEELRSCITEGD